MMAYRTDVNVLDDKSPLNSAWRTRLRRDSAQPGVHAHVEVSEYIHTLPIIPS